MALIASLSAFGLLSSCGSPDDVGVSASDSLNASSSLTNSDSKETKTKKDQKDQKGSLRVSSERDLPECVAEIEGTYAYIRSSKYFVTCVDGEWVVNDSEQQN